MTKITVEIAYSILEDSWLLYSSDHDGWVLRNKLREMIDRLELDMYED